MEELRFIEKTAEYDIIADFTGDYKPLAENEGRTGYFHVCKEGEEKRHKPVFEVGTYENGTFIPQAR